VLGIGLNVAARLEELPHELRLTAATLGESPGAIEPTLQRLLEALESRLAAPLEEIMEAWRARDALLGREVAWSGGRGRAAGIDRTGRLVVRGGRGGRHCGPARCTSLFEMAPIVGDESSDLAGGGSRGVGLISRVEGFAVGLLATAV
jgi:biotin-(acetyl-CoA carboxylase) ligase